MSGRIDTVLNVCDTLLEAKKFMVRCNDANEIENKSSFGRLYCGNMGFLVCSLNIMACTVSSIKPVQRVLREDLTYHQKAELTKRIDRLLKNVKVTDVGRTTANISQHPGLASSIINVILDYLTKKLKMEVA